MPTHAVASLTYDLGEFPDMVNAELVFSLSFYVTLYRIFGGLPCIHDSCVKRYRTDIQQDIVSGSLP